MLARRAVNPAVRTVWARRDPTVSYVPPVVGSSYTRPTQYVMNKDSKSFDWQEPTVWFLRMSRGPSRACPSFTARRRGSLRISLGDLAWTRGDTLEG